MSTSHKAEQAKATVSCNANEPQNTLVVIAIAVVLFCVAAIPLAAVENLPFIDYPEHLATFHTLFSFPESEHLKSHYEIRDGVYPYWGIRAMMSALVPLFGVEGGLRAFTVLAMLMPAAGVCALNWTLAGRITLLPLVSLIFVYNDVLHWGLLNFLFVTGVALIFFSAWLSLRGKPAGLRFLFLSLAALCLIWLHPLAAFMFGLMAGLWELANWVQHSRKEGSLMRFGTVVLTGLCFMPALASVLLLSDFKGNHVNFAMGGLMDRAWIAMSPFWLGLGSAANLAVGLVALVALLRLLSDGTLKLANGMSRYVIYFITAAFAAPFVALGVFYINLRLPIFAFFMLVAGLQFAEIDKRRRNLVVGFFAVLLVGKLLTTALALSAGSDKITELRNAIVAVPAGAKVLPVIDRTSPEFPGSLTESDYHNLSSYLIVDRDAYIPDIFGTLEVTHAQTETDIPPMLAPPSYLLLDLPINEWEPKDMIFAEHTKSWRSRYDYLLVINFGAQLTNPAGTQTISDGSYFRILKVVNDEAR